MTSLRRHLLRPILQSCNAFLFVFTNTCDHTFPSSQYSILFYLYFPGCPGAKKTEFLTSVLDALSTDMVHAVTDPASAGRYVSNIYEQVQLFAN